MKKINPLLVREINVLNRQNDLEELYRLEMFPVFIGATSESVDSDMFADMIFDISKKSGLIQLRDLLDPDLIYSGYHSEALGGVWQGHHEQFAQLIGKYKLDNVLEIGGSNGTLAELVDEQYQYKLWTMVEPNPAVESSGKIKIVKDHFGKNTDLGDLEIDGVIHSHTLEHLYNPKECLDKIYEILGVGDKHIFSIPNLLKWLESGFPNTINFEHTLFLTEDILDVLLQNCGFKILEKKYYLEHSIFYVTEKMDKTKEINYKNNYESYKNLYLNFVNGNIKSVQNLNNFIDNYDGKVYLFGGHIFSQFLIHLGLNQDKIVCILDNSTIKQGKRLYGTKMKIITPETIKDLKKVAVILRAGAYTEEITKQLKEINSKVEIID